MTVSDELLEAMELQVQRELNSHDAYLTMSNWLEYKDWPGFSHFMRKQGDEEYKHAMKFVDFVNENGYYVAIDKPSQLDIGSAKNPSSVQDVFRIALEQEMAITDHINNLTSIAKRNDDDGAMDLLQWFEREQIEEEELMESYLNRIDRANGSSSAMMVLDKECAER
jgi:ferritin